MKFRRTLQQIIHGAFRGNCNRGLPFDQLAPRTRWKSRVAHSSSSCWIAFESAGSRTRSASAGRVAPPCAATAMTYWSTRRFMRRIHLLRLLKYENSVLDVAA